MQNTGSVSHEAGTIQEFRDNPAEAAAYLQAVLDDGGEQEIQLARSRISAAFDREATDLTCSLARQICK